MPFMFTPPAGLPAGQWEAADLNQRIQIWRYINPGADALQMAVVTDAIIKDWAVTHYGALAAYLDDPEIGPILTQAASGGWSQERISAAVEGTNYWKTTSTAQRAFDATQRQDPGQAIKQIDDAKASITNLLTTEGVIGQYSEERITDLATQLVRNGTPTDQIPRFVLADAAYNPTVQGGTLGAQATQVKGSAFQYGLPISDQAAFDWAKKIEMKTATAEGLTDFLKQTAMAAYGSDPHLAAQLDAGFTVRQVMDPQLQTAAQMLGVDPDTIDFRDEKWAPVLQYDTGSGVRTRTLDETAKYIKGDQGALGDQYWNTSGAEASAAQFVLNLGKQFGKVG